MNQPHTSAGTNPPEAVTRRLGLTVVADLGGRRDGHWLATRQGARFVLRRFAPKPFGDIAYEMSVLEALGKRGWPVPAPAVEPFGMDGTTWGLFEWLPGAPIEERSSDDQRMRGRLLAALHDELDDLDSALGLGQRGGCQEAHEVVEDPELDTQLAAHERWFPEDALVMRWHLDRARTLFDRADLASARRTVLHSDFAPWNLLYRDGDLSGVLDFETTHRNFVVADFALSWRGEADAVIEGYRSVRPLDEADLHLLTPVFWAWMFLGVVDALRAMHDGRIEPRRLQWTVTNLLKRSSLMGAEARPWVAP